MGSGRRRLSRGSAALSRRPRPGICARTGLPEREEGGPQPERRPGDESEQLRTVLDEHGSLRGRHQEVGDRRDPERSDGQQEESDVEFTNDHVPESYDEPEEGEPVCGGGEHACQWCERRGLMQEEEVVDDEHEGQHGDPQEQPGQGCGSVRQGEPPDRGGAARERQHDDADVRDQSVCGARAGVARGDDLAVAHQVARRKPWLQDGRRHQHHDRKEDGQVGGKGCARQDAVHPRSRAFIRTSSTHDISTPTHATLRSGFWVREGTGCATTPTACVALGQNRQMRCRIGSAARSGHRRVPSYGRGCVQ